MTIQPEVINLLNLFFKVVIISLIISSPFIIAILEMYGYEKYKKYKDSEVKEKEKIIVKKAQDIETADKQLQWQSEEQHRKQLQLKSLKKQIEIKQLELQKGKLLNEPDAETSDPEDEKKQKTLNDLSIRELKELAKQNKLKMYSKLNKEQLVKFLDERGIKIEQ